MVRERRPYPVSYDDRHTLLLEGYGYRWYRVGGLDYLLKRSDIDTDAPGKGPHPA